VDRLQPPSPTHRPCILGPDTSTVERPHATTAFVDDPNGHRNVHQRREDNNGYVYAHGLLPPNGTPSGFDPFHPNVPPPWHDRFDSAMHDSFAPTLSQLPKVPFPTFDGDNPKLWQKRRADYFSMYSVHPRVWIHIATMHFSDAILRSLRVPFLARPSPRPLFHCHYLPRHLHPSKMILLQMASLRLGQLMISSRP
jgi:hypothetical protein